MANYLYDKHIVGFEKFDIMTAKDTGFKFILKLYDIAWWLCIPMLSFNRRVQDGFDTRRSSEYLKPADIWIQAASAGEAYLACSILNQLKPRRPIRVILTTNTRQGLDIINKGIVEVTNANSGIIASASYFPFDRPAIMDAAVAKINPQLMVLLETEIWPGLLNALKKNNTRILIINGRLTPKSLHRYMKWNKILRHLSPDKILAISESDAMRFGQLFGHDRVDVMNNIKFDRLDPSLKDNDNFLRQIINEAAPFFVLGSVRQEEESLIELIIRDVYLKLPNIITGLFPRHMHRIDYWRNALDRSGLKWQLRSDLNGKTVDKGTIILWDTFGELDKAYALANAVFVGGSLVPLGGQNFLEPLIYGIKPVIGPYWDNFTWVGQEIIEQGLVIKTDTWQTVSTELIRQLSHPLSKEAVRESAVRYIKDRTGGTEYACRLIREELTE